jgi:hypothetical protein
MPDLWTIVLLGATALAVTELLLLEHRRRLFLSRPQRRAANAALHRERGRRPESDVLRNARAVIARQAAALATRSAAGAAAGDVVDGNGDPFATHAVHYVLQTMRAKSPPARTGFETPATGAVTESGAAAAALDVAAAHAGRLHAVPADVPDAPAVTEVALEPSPHGTPPATQWDAGGALEGALHDAPPQDAGGPAPSATTREAIVYVDARGRLTFANRVARELLHWNTGGMALSDLLAGGLEESAALLESVARQELVRVPMTLLAGGAPLQAEINALALRDRNGSLWGAALFIRRAPGTPS